MQNILLPIRVQQIEENTVCKWTRQLHLKLDNILTVPDLFGLNFFKLSKQRIYSTTTIYPMTDDADDAVLAVDSDPALTDDDFSALFTILTS